MQFLGKMKAAAAAIAVTLSATGVLAAAQPGVSGTITQVGSDSVSIKISNGQVITIKMNDATVVKVNGQVAKASDLNVGMNAMVIGQHLSLGNPATEIRAYTPKPATNPSAQPGGVRGTITQVGSDSVSIKISNGKVITIKMNDATVVKVNGQAAKASDLNAGMNAMVIGQHLSMGNPATEIRAYTPTTK